MAKAKKKVVKEDSLDKIQQGIRKAQDDSRASIIKKSAADHQKSLKAKK